MFYFLYNWNLTVITEVMHIFKYSQTCIKRSPMGQRKSDLIRPMPS